MDTTEIKHVIEAALLAARRPLTLDKLGELFSSRGSGLEKQELRTALEALTQDYAGRGVELKEVAGGFRIQVRRTMSDWLMPLWEERAPRYTRALLETLALIAYRQPITRGEIEEVRGVAVSTNIVRTLMERSWVRVVGHRDVPGKPAMFGTTREFLDYFGLKRLDELPPLAEIKDWIPEESPQTDLVESLRDAAGMMTSFDGEALPAGNVSQDTTAEESAAREAAAQQADGQEPEGQDAEGQDADGHEAEAAQETDAAQIAQESTEAEPDAEPTESTEPDEVDSPAEPAEPAGRAEPAGQARQAEPTEPAEPTEQADQTGGRVEPNGQTEHARPAAPGEQTAVDDEATEGAATRTGSG